MKLFLSILAIVFIPIGSADAQSSSCLKLLNNPYDSTWHNPDSIMIDSCISSPTYLHKFAKQWFNLDFQYGSMLPIPAAPVDSIIDVEWTQIDTAYAVTRAGFDTLQLLFGHFILRKGLPRVGDTADFNSRSFVLKFDSLVDIQVAVNQMLAIPLLAIGSVSYQNRGGVFNSVVQHYVKKEGLTIRPDPASSQILVSAEILKDVNDYEIFSTTGQLVRKDVLTINHPIISTLSLPPALYFLKINGEMAGKFLVTH